VVSVGSNSVTLIDTATNKIKGAVYLGRSPHEPFFTPNGRELWVTVRGENYVSVIDPARMKETRRIELANGPGMTMFGPDGKYAFVCSSFTPELAVIDVASHQIIKRTPQVSPFAPNSGDSGERRGMDHVERRGKGAGVQCEAALCAKGGAKHRADYQSCELRKQSQRQVRVCDHWRRERSEGVP
jgi:YVTN family beta-propeller protein